MWGCTGIAFLPFSCSKMGCGERLFGRISRQRGLDSEGRVELALNHLTSANRIDSFERNGVLDQKGIDFLVICGSKKYKISVKSSKGGVFYEFQNHPDRVRKRDLIFVIPSSQETIEDLASRIIEEISSFEERMHNR